MRWVRRGSRGGGSVSVRDMHCTAGEEKETVGMRMGIRWMG